MDTSSPIAEIKSLVAESRTSDALSRLLELSQGNKQVHDAILILSGEFSDLTSQQLKGTIDNTEATRRRNVVHDKILIALGAFDSRGRVVPGSGLVKKTSSVGMLGRITVSFVIIGGLVMLVASRMNTWPYSSWMDTPYFSVGAGFLFLGFWSFTAYLLTIVISAFKK